jgi:two-component system, OmpR family, sensor kinase
MHVRMDVAGAGVGSTSEAMSARGALELEDGEGKQDGEAEARALLRIACHDLSAPLGAIHLKAEAFRRQLGENGQPPRDKILAFVDRIERLALDASRLVGDVLAVDDGGAAVSRASEQDLEAALRSAISFHAESLSAAGSKIVVTCEVDRSQLRGVWDPRALESIFSNLLQNAIRHAPGASIAIRFARSGDDVMIRFSDSARAQPPNQPASGGHGLGMWIIGRAVARLGGTVAVQSDPRSGFVVDVRIPARTIPAR